MDFLTTYTGESVSPLTPNANQIHIKDIAHALSLICRANGHFAHFYSVAQHCINCANEAKARGLSERVQFACLLHDGSEAYLSDITRPVKKHLPGYLEIEKPLQDMIYKKFLGYPLSEDESALVKQVDDDMLMHEFNALMDNKTHNRLPDIHSKPSFIECDYQAVENMFTKLADNLMHGKPYFSALGIDGCHGGWCVVRLDSLGISTLRFMRSIDELLNRDDDIAIIDMPIGLPRPGEERVCDKETRKLLEKRSCSVFTVPCREVVQEISCTPGISYEKACEISLKWDSKKITQQTFAIIPKIHEVDKYMCENPDMREYLFESHPELCFKTLSDNPCKNHKTAPHGEYERITALRKHMDIGNLLSLKNLCELDGIETQTNIRASKDDIIDAAVLALTGLMSLEGEKYFIPNDKNPQTDNMGLKMRMLIAKELQKNE